MSLASVFFVNEVILVGLRPLLKTIKIAVTNMIYPETNSGNSLSSTFGQSVAPLGRRNLQLLEILDDMMKVNSDTVDKAIHEADFFHLIPVDYSQ
jgi:hypothetical protein